MVWQYNQKSILVVLCKIDCVGESLIVWLAAKDFPYKILHTSKQFHNTVEHPAHVLSQYTRPTAHTSKHGKAIRFASHLAPPLMRAFLFNSTLDVPHCDLFIPSNAQQHLLNYALPNLHQPEKATRGNFEGGKTKGNPPIKVDPRIATARALWSRRLITDQSGALKRKRTLESRLLALETPQHLCTTFS